MQKTSLFAAINTASRVVIQGFEIEDYKAPRDGSGDKAMLLRADDDKAEWVFDEQQVEIDSVEGVVTAIDRDGESHDISLTFERPLTLTDVLRRTTLPGLDPTSEIAAGYTDELWEVAGSRIGTDAYGIMAEFYGLLPYGNAKRAALSANACRGVPNEALGNDLLATLIENDRIMRAALASIAAGAHQDGQTDGQIAGHLMKTAEAAIGQLKPTA